MAAAALAFSGLRVDFASNPFLIAAGIAYWVIAWIYRSVRADEQIAAAIETTGQLLLIVLLGIILIPAPELFESALCGRLSAETA